MYCNPAYRYLLPLPLGTFSLGVKNKGQSTFYQTICCVFKLDTLWKLPLAEAVNSGSSILKYKTPKRSSSVGSLNDILRVLASHQSVESREHSFVGNFVNTTAPLSLLIPRSLGFLTHST